MPRDSFGRKSGDWSEEERQGSKVVRYLAQRAWILIVPLIAVGFYNGKFLGPATKKAEEQIATEKRSAEEKRNKTLSDSRRIGVGISALRALSDTFQVRYGKIDVLIDSVMVLRVADQVEVSKLEAEGESLRTVYSLASGKSSELSALLPPMQAKIDSLKILIAAREEQIRKLLAERQADQDLTQRVMHPELFRKNTALVTGSGDFPNRDALPKR